MPLYVDVGVARIQHYLTRWPNLRGQRGASRLVKESTLDVLEDKALRGFLHGEAGHADGVVHLKISDGSDPEKVAAEALQHMRRQVPAVEFQAGWALGDSYAHAAPLIRQAMNSAAGDPRAFSAVAEIGRPVAEDGGTSFGGIRSLPPVAELPILERCELCRIDVAEGKVPKRDQGDEESAACRDCLKRHDAARRMEEEGKDAGAVAANEVEQALIEALKLDPAWEFKQLAELGPPVRGIPNHLATVLIDGNAMGALFRQLDKAEPEARSKVSLAINEATKQAVVGASLHIKEGKDTCLPVIPHVTGGDDVALSMPARRAWPFVRSYMEEFERLTAEALHEHVLKTLQGGPDRVTASAGIAFAHVRHPYASACELAKAALDLAKRECRGLSASRFGWDDVRSTISWADHTCDGDKLPDGRQVYLMKDLRTGAALHEVIEQIAGTGEEDESGSRDRDGTARKAKGFDQSRIHALDAAASGDGDSSVGTRRGRLRREMRRLGVRNPAYDYLNGLDIDRAADILRMVRWWYEPQR